jgi:uncharacterized protein YaaQ
MLSDPALGVESAVAADSEGHMSKLLVAVVREPNLDPLLAGLISRGHRATVIQSMGGFLRDANHTILVAVEEDDLGGALDVFSQATGAEVEVPLFVSERLVDWRAPTVQYAGATIFIVNLEGIVRT